MDAIKICYHHYMSDDREKCRCTLVSNIYLNVRIETYYWKENGITSMLVYQLAGGKHIYVIFRYCYTLDANGKKIFNGIVNVEIEYVPVALGIITKYTKKCVKAIGYYNVNELYTESNIISLGMVITGTIKDILSNG